MPSTNFPKGVSVSTSVRTVAGELFAETGNISGALVVGGTASVGGIIISPTGTAGQGFIGQRIVLTGTFTSAAGTVVVPVPMAGNIVDIYTVCDTTPRTCSGFTVQNGTDGTVAVATVALAFATAITQQVKPTFTVVAVTTASGLRVIVTTAGSAANFGWAIVIEKTA